MAYCSNCGAELVGRFCSSCGADAETNTAGCDAGKMEVTEATTSPLTTTGNTQAFVPSKRCNKLEIDERGQRWRVLRPGEDAFKKKPSALGKATLAVMTGGMSLAASAISKGIKNNASPSFSFDQLVSYDLLEDDNLVTSGGVGRALIGGTLFGGVGAIVGGVTAKRTTKKVVNTLIIKITANDFQTPCILIPLINTKTKTNSKEYQKAFQEAQQILSLLDVIAHRK